LVTPARSAAIAAALLPILERKQFVFQAALRGLINVKDGN
jgi:hypothetical protein